jgi:hypothetical protein
MKTFTLILVFALASLVLAACSPTPAIVVTATPNVVGTLQSQVATLQAKPTDVQTTAIPATAVPATAVPASNQQVPLAASNNCGDKTLQTIYLTVVNPEAAPQPQIGHPSAYQETHVSDIPVCIVLDVPQNYMGIVGGVTIDKQTNGVYIGFGPGHYEFVVTNGFGLITTESWAKAEWDFRIQQTVTYGWANANLKPGPIQ